MSLSKSTSHLEFDRVLQTPAYFMKGASAATLNEWDTETPETVRPRSALIKRPASHPQLVPDTSVRAVEESLFRRTLHDYLCQSNPGAFRKSLLPESPSEYYLQKHLVRDLLCDIHKNRAPHDIANPKRGHEPVKNFKKKPVPVELQTKIEDFLQPGDPTRRRQTGYSPGHIRSVLHLDTFGPNQAKAVDTQRKQGLLPISPNSADKNISEDGSSHAGSRRGSQNWSRTSSRPASPSGLGLESINESKADSLPSVQFAADHVHHTRAGASLVFCPSASPRQRSTERLWRCWTKRCSTPRRRRRPSNTTTSSRKNLSIKQTGRCMRNGWKKSGKTASKIAIISSSVFANLKKTSFHNWIRLEM